MSNKNWFVIVNPAAGSGRGKKRWPKISNMLSEAGIDHDFEYTTKQGHAMSLSKQAVENGYRNILAIGGDGTNNEVMNGIMQQEVVPSAEVKYGIIPVGTGNDWIRTHKIPKNTKKVIEIIKAGNTRFQDIGLVRYKKDGDDRQRYFMNVAGMSYDAFVTKVSNEKPNFVSNKIFYLFLIFSCLRAFKPRRAKVIFNDKEVEDLLYTVNVGVCRYSGGGMQFVPHAIPDDGLFALTIAGNVNKMEVMTVTPRFYNGTLAKHPKIDTYKTKKLRVEAVGNLPTLLEVDGEYLGHTPAEFVLIEKAFQFFAPK